MDDTVGLQQPKVVEEVEHPLGFWVLKVDVHWRCRHQGHWCGNSNGHLRCNGCWWRRESCGFVGCNWCWGHKHQGCFFLMFVHRECFNGIAHLVTTSVTKALDWPSLVFGTPLG